MTSSRFVLAWLFAAFWLALANPALAQDDGPRVYQPAPIGARILTTFAVAKRGNELSEPGSLRLGANLATNTVVFRYAQVFDFAGRPLTPFLIVPFGEVTATNSDLRPTSRGLGDMQVGATWALAGARSYSRAEFAEWRPSASVLLLGRIYIPTGEYNSANPVNLGSNRLSVQLGAPVNIRLAGRSYLDPGLTTLELLPTLTLYDDNLTSAGERLSKDPLFGVEAHLTRNFSRQVWISADLLFKTGGETSTDGVGDGNAMSGLSAGASLGYAVHPRISLILSYSAVVARNDEGPDGGFFRAALVAPF